MSARIATAKITPTSQASSNENDKPERMALTFKDVARAVQIHRDFVLRSCAAAGGLAILYLLIAPSQYTATGRLIIEPRGQQILGIDNVLPALNSELASIESQVELLRSRRIAERALAKLTLAATDPTVTPASAASPVDEVALRRLMKRSAIERKGLSYLIDVTYTDSDPETAAKTANALLDAYITDQLDVKFAATRAANTHLQKSVAETSTAVRIAEERVQKYRAEHGLINIGELELAQKELSDLAAQVMSTQTRELEANARLLQVQELAKSPELLNSLGRALESTVVVDLRKQQAEVQRKLANLISRFGAQHPSVADAQAEADKVNQDVTSEIGRLVQSAQNEARLAKMMVNLLSDTMDQLKAKYASRNLAAIKLRELERDAETSQQLYNVLLRRLKETQAQETLQTSDSRIITYASAPLDRSSPMRLLTLAAALIAGLMFGVGRAVWQEAVDRRPKIEDV